MATKSSVKSPPSPAAALIAAKGRKDISLPEDAERELRALVDHNDTCHVHERVGRRAAQRMLADHFGVVVGDDALNKICVSQLGRTSYAHR